MAKQCLTHRCVNFNARLEIGMCQHVKKYFSTRLPPEGRSERDGLVGVHVDRNGGRRKKLPATGYSDGGYGFRDDCNATEV